ncbi:enoyl-CoA hydratase/isomerase family protein [Metallibacterium scheffleri]|uniref:Enoyl-CoA hydratase n=1 Tax=Metallibacterium scheffleri TaxID=993689 RepID=A0A4S3KIV8_9GAMM|nr:enoyl-CoA hydratase/isomerase family protein [Metallibacterium scheffleri]THD08579.1 enoyl-CoA hydratase [Metallibacterium scheffleri]
MLHITEHDYGIRELRLARPPVNALDAGLIRALRLAIEAAPAQGAQALLISGSPGLFSAGLDVPALLALDAPALQHCFEDFFGMAAALAQSPIPVAAAITGHSPAGGAVIALFCDYRVMAAGPFRIGLNEVQVGLTVPTVIRDALARLLGPYRAERLLVSGTMLEAEAALRIGMVDELTEVDQVPQRALLWLQALLALPRQAMLETRAVARADLIAMTQREHLPIAQFGAVWQRAETQATLHALVARLKAGKPD